MHKVKPPLFEVACSNQRGVTICQAGLKTEGSGINTNYKTTKVKLYLANSAIAVLIVVAVMIFAVSFFQLPKLDHLLYNYIEINRFVQRLFSLLLLLIAWNLFARKQLAWMLSVVLLSINLFMHFVFHHHFMNIPIIVCEVYALSVLLLCQSSFRRPSNKLSLRQAVFLAALGILALFFNAVIGRANLSAHIGKPASLWASLGNTIGILFGENSGFPAYEWFIFCFVWLCAAGCVILVLRSAIIDKRITKAEKIRAHELVKKYGQNPTSYLTLEDDKLLYFGQEVEGVVAYGVVGRVVVVNGDPVCAPADFVRLLAEFQAFCTGHSYQCVFMSVTEQFITQYAMLGYSYLKWGEEARFELNDYHLAGGRMAKLRALINHANKAGLTTYEYKPNQKKDAQVEKGINEVSAQWLKGKKSGQLEFSLGGVGLEEPLERRYFYAQNQQGQIVAFNVFIPFAGMNGYMADVTRRLPDAPGGATEKITYDAFMTFKSEGIQWGSIGLSPLANVRGEGIKDGMTAKLLEFIYEKCNDFYGFKDLYRVKERYGPSAWLPGYLVYSSKTFAPQIAYAIVKIQNPGGIKDYLGSLLRSKLRNARKCEQR